MSGEHIFGLVHYIAPQSWAWSVVNEQSGETPPLAAGAEFTQAAAFRECLKVTDALRTAHAYLIKTPKGLRG